MKKIKVIVILGALTSQLALAGSFTLSSKSLPQGSAIGSDLYWNNFGCSGKNIMPDLQWTNAPKGVKSYAITMYDKDAPTGSGFWHWVAYNIPAQVSELPGGVDGGKLSAGVVQGNTDLSKPGFFGPCPPVGRQHHYVYTIHALKVEKLDIDASASAALIGFNLSQNSLGKAELKFTAGPRSK
jgi:Raf kinase inhibitor-like YbhB/YbcL family protein